MTAEEKNLIGIHVGSHYTCVAFSQVRENDGISGANVDILTNEDGDRLIPSQIMYTDHDDILLGTAARQQKPSNPQNALSHILRVLFKKLHHEKLPSSCTFRLSENEEYKLRNEQLISPKKVLSDYLKLLKSTVIDNALQLKTIDGISITIPADMEKNIDDEAIQSVFQLAGLPAPSVVPEPIAYYNASLDNSSNVEENVLNLNENVLIIDCGSFHSTLTLVGIRSGISVILDSSTRYDIGGDVLTQGLVGLLCQDFCRKYKFPVEDVKSSKKAMQKLYHQAENAKHVLSNCASANLSIESFFEGIDFQNMINRMRFENIEVCYKMFEEFSKFLSEFISTLNDKEITNIDKAIICGGSTQVPKIRDIISKVLPKCVECKIDKNLAMEAAALGSALDLSYRIGFENSRNKVKAEQQLFSPFKISIASIDENDENHAQIQINLIQPYQPLPYSVSIEVQPRLGENTGFIVFLDEIGNQIIGGMEISDLQNSETANLWLTAHFTADLKLNVELVDRSSFELDSKLKVSYDL